MDRRRFLRGKFQNTAQVLRPPWAIDERSFIERCTRCSACIEVCPTAILRKGEGGFPEVDFRLGECTFCEACVDQCPSQALSRTISPPWPLKASLSEACLAQKSIVCMSCRDHCPEQAITLKPRVADVALPIIDTHRCNGCGACVAPCPSAAIQLQRDS
jgi:ferredoxin-type protein NapF